MFKFILNYAIIHRVQLITFILVGVSTSCIYFSCFHLFYHFIKLDYRMASTLAYIITISCHFILNRQFTFSAANQNAALNGGKYFFMLLFNYMIMLSTLWIAVSRLTLSPYVGAFFSVSITALMSFFIMKYFVFAFHEQ